MAASINNTSRLHLLRSVRRTQSEVTSFVDTIAKKRKRKLIESKISEITTRFHKKIHAVTIEGFQSLGDPIKVFLTIMAFGLIKYILN